MADKWQRWYNNEVEILKENYPKAHKEELMKLLPGRTWRTIGNTAEKYGIHRNRNITKTEEEIAALHTKMSVARGKRTEQPFAGKHHTAETKLAISVANLHARGHSIADIAKRNRIAEKVVEKILDKKK